jgi:hypothetical protein
VNETCILYTMYDETSIGGGGFRGSGFAFLLLFTKPVTKFGMNGGLTMMIGGSWS